MTESGGAVDIVTDEEILLAQRWLAANEGIFVEPASAAGVAGLLRYTREDAPEGRALPPLRAVPDEGVIVITVTGHGLKDPDTILKQNIALAPPIPATREAILGLLQSC